jgi:hypothetical protein
MGKQASQLYLAKGVNLNDAIVKLAAESPVQLGTEHVRRVAEFANNTTHQELFTKSADKLFSFPLADAERIIQDLHSGAAGKIPVVSARDAVEAAMPKMSAPTTYFPGMDSAGLEAGFKEGFQAQSDEGHEMGKVAEYPQVNPFGKEARLLDNLKAAGAQLNAQRDGLAIMLDEVAMDLSHQVKQASLYGLTLADIRHALGQVAQHPHVLDGVLKEAEAKLSRDLEFHNQDQSVKTASGVLNKEHPLVKSYQLFEELSHKDRVLEKAAASIEQQRIGVDRRLRANLRHADR